MHILRGYWIDKYQNNNRKTPQGRYVVYPLGLSGILLSEVDTYQEALENIKCTIKFHQETFHKEAYEDEAIIEIFIEK